MKKFLLNFLKNFYTMIYDTLDNTGVFKYFKLLFLKSKSEKTKFFKEYFHKNKTIILVFVAIVLLVFLVFKFNLNKPIATLVILIVGMITHFFTELLALVALIPFVGPIIVKVISIPFIILLNAFTYAISFFALKKGYRVEIVKSRSFTLILLTGILIGYIIGKIL